MPRSFREICELWPSCTALAEDIGAPLFAVRKWPQRNRIPPTWWTPLLRSETAKAAGLSADELAAMAARDQQ